MAKLNLAALRVRQNALAQRSNGKVSKTPCWIDIMSNIPPSTVLVRKQPQQHPLVQQRVKTIPGKSQPQVVTELCPNRRKKSKKASRMFQPLEIRYEEDQLRKEFFRDHPWELARPRVLLENDGNDHSRYDWSKLQQKGKRLDGESVVQRQLYLLNTVPDITKSAAYDIARREFYHLRLQEDVERQIAQEEAAATGAYFGPDMLTVGMGLENQVYDRWKVWSEKESMLQIQRSAAFTGNTLPETKATTSEDEEEPKSLDAEMLDALQPIAPA